LVISHSQQRITAIGAFYQRSYDFLKKQKDRVPLIIHHGYCGLPQWADFVSDKDPGYLIMEDHPCSSMLRRDCTSTDLCFLDAGTFASTNGEDDALGGVCYKAQEYVKYAVPVIVSEWTLSLRTGGADLVPKMFVQQVSAFAVRLFILLLIVRD
jgi:glucan 1,3-beta-glucosidase